MVDLVNSPRVFVAQPRYATKLDYRNPLTRGLRGFWLPAGDGLALPFNRVTGKQSISLPNGPVGIISTPFGRAYNFAASNIDTGETIDISGTQLTIAVKLQVQTNTSAMLFGNHGSSTTGYLLYQNGLSVGCYTDSTNRGSSANFTVNTWNQVALSYFGGVLWSALNGVVTSASQAMTVSPVGLTTLLGSYNWPGFPLFTGQAEYFAVWDRGLTAQELVNFQSNPYALVLAPTESVPVSTAGVINLVGAPSEVITHSPGGVISQSQVLAGVNAEVTAHSSTGAISISSGTVTLTGANCRIVTHSQNAAASVAHNNAITIQKIMGS